MSVPEIVVESLSWTVDRTEILAPVDLTCRAGRVTGLLGPNGSGKTTLLHMVAGLRTPSTGSVRIDGVSVHRASARERAQLIALVEQESNTGLPLTVEQVVELGRIPYRPRWGAWVGSDEGEKAVTAAMRAAQVEHLAQRTWSTLSGGERQRTHLARALAQEPRVLLLDEPTNHLDLGHQLDFLERVRGLGVTTVAALHDLELAAAYCDDVVVLEKGRLVAAGPVAEVLTGELIERVYGVDADVEPHPVHGRPHVRWNGRVGGLRG